MKIINNWVQGATSAEGVSFEVRPLTVGGAMTISGFLEGKEGKPDSENVVELFKVAKRVFESSECIRNLKGVEIETDGVATEATPMDLPNHIQFATLIVEIFYSFLEVSQLTGADSKNSKGPSRKGGKSGGTPNPKAAK